MQVERGVGYCVCVWGGNSGIMTALVRMGSLFLNNLKLCSSNMMKLLYDANCVCVVVAHCGRGPAAVQPSVGDGGNPEIPVCHAHLQLHPGSNVCNTHIYTHS